MNAPTDCSIAALPSWWTEQSIVEGTRARVRVGPFTTWLARDPGESRQA